MNEYIKRRLLLTLPITFGVLTLVFFFIHMIPGDPIDAMLGETATLYDKDILRKELGLDKPIFTQYLQYLKNIFLGDLGISIHNRMPVFSLIIKKLPATIELSLAAMLVAIIISLPLGIISALKKDTIFDHTGTTFSLLGISIPNFWLGPMLMILFSLELGIFPVSGRGTVLHLILPAITLGTTLSAILTRMIRSSLIEELKKEYIVAAYAKGLNVYKVVTKHALKNTFIPVITIVGLQFGSLLSGAVITETIFSWPGIGRLTIQAIYKRDYPLVQGCILIISLMYVLVNLLVDISYAYFDPRVRYEKK